MLVFDEIDANVGGRLGSIIGNKLRGLAEHHQVLCITHLPQIASYADRHLTVRKEVVGNATETKVRVMDGADRLQELAEMIGGQRITDTTPRPGAGTAGRRPCRVPAAAAKPPRPDAGAGRPTNGETPVSGEKPAPAQAGKAARAGRGGKAAGVRCQGRREAGRRGGGRRAL